jgi:hypothetical protein
MSVCSQCRSKEVWDVFPKNEHGHRVITLTGSSTSGSSDVYLFRRKNFFLTPQVEQCLTGEQYDAEHRLRTGERYRLAVVLSKELQSRARTTENLCAYVRPFGYQQPLAGIVTHLRQAITDVQLEQMGIEYLAGLHDPLLDRSGNPQILALSCHTLEGKSSFCSASGDPESKWNERGAFVFEIPE